MTKPQTLAEQIRALEPPRGMGPASIMRSGWNEAIKAAAALADAETLDDPECTDCEGSGITHQTERYCTCDMGRELFAESANNPDPTPVVMPEWSTSDKARHYAAMVTNTNDADILRAAISDLCRDNERLAVMLKSAKQPAPTSALGCKAMQAELATLRAERDAMRISVEALGAMPEGYCFCSKDRIGDDSKSHEPECADLRSALAKIGEAK